MKYTPIVAESEFRIVYPFFKSTVQEAPTGTWLPGTYYEARHANDEVSVCDGVGQMILKVVDVHKPGKYPERVFFVRTWIDPVGQVYGSTRLKITTTYTFNKLIQGYRYTYRINESHPKVAPLTRLTGE